MTNKKTNRSFFLFALIMILIDQGTKLYFKGFNFFGLEHEGLGYGELIPVFGDFLQFTYILNPGMAFGMTIIPKIILSLFSILASIGIAWYLSKIIKAHYFIKLSIALIFSGAVGNLIDRVFYGAIFGENPSVMMMNSIDTFVYEKVLQGFPLFYGKVVDFIQVDIPDVSFMGLNYSHWPVFNIADSCVSVGVVLLIIFNKHLPNISDLSNRKKDVITESVLEKDSENGVKDEAAG